MSINGGVGDLTIDPRYMMEDHYQYFDPELIDPEMFNNPDMFDPNMFQPEEMYGDDGYYDPDMYGEYLPDEEMMYDPAYLEEQGIDPEWYYENYGYPYHDDMHDYVRISMSELFDHCIWPTLSQAMTAMWPLLVFCLVHRLMYSFLSKDEGSSYRVLPSWLLHLSSAMLGLLVAHQFFQETCIYLAILIIFTYIVLFITRRILHGYSGLLVAAVTVVYLLTCELFVVPLNEWHQIRGAQMVATMKVVSLSFDLDQGRVTEMPSLWAFLGYILHPGSVVFGPWVSYTEYANHDLHAKKSYSMFWVMKVCKSLLLGLLFVSMSSCFVPWIILETWGIWAMAYRDAQSFRFSHFFISYISEATMTMSGLGATKTNGDVRWDLKVAQPLNVEFPRSLVEVVTSWNLPMHYWLKTYVFKTAKPLGAFLAVLMTYAASSLLHGLNFQLSAVLLSLGFYSYAEYVLRRKLMHVFDACIGAKRCRECEHIYTSMHPYVILANLGFGLLTVFHLAYLGLMFDSSDQEEEGYTMWHTLAKWEGLGYTSHMVALGTYLFYFLI